ncbi:MAG TPA: hypothetical protein VJH37_02665 [Candidatus Nanoarchaeia archaeon]|nr:hypothetical protein [Candidatus Nanoarchaeia archaeon]
MQDYKKRVFQDILIISMSILFAIGLINTRVLESLLASSLELEMMGSFIAGMFFTSIFTTVPSMVALGEIARINNVFLTAVFGGLGAMVVDYILFLFMRDRFSNDLISLLKHVRKGKQVKIVQILKHYRWLTMMIAGIIIASPLPDELAINLLGFSKLKTSLFILFSFVFNFTGIAVIGIIARAI